MSRTLNKVQLIGRLGANVELRYTQSGTPVASFNLATNRFSAGQNGQEGHEETEWHRIVLWDKLAETANEYLTKGSQVYIEGRLQTRSWDDQQGQKRYTTEIVGQTMIMLDSRPQSSEGQSSDAQPSQRSNGSNGSNGSRDNNRNNTNGSSRRQAAIEEPELEAEELPF